MRRINRSFLLVLFASSGLAFGNAQAQSGSTAPTHPRVDEVDQRQQNLQNRIDQGVSDGGLNAREATRLQNQQSRISEREQADLAAHDGHLTAPETHRLNRAENRLSRHVHRQRNDAQ